jgi:hypothetical protein
LPLGWASEVKDEGISPVIYFERGQNREPLHKFELAMAVLSAEYLATNNDEAAITIIDAIKSWASANALSSLGGSDYVATIYDVKSLVTPTLVSYSLVRNHPYLSAEDQALIEKWLEMLVRQIDAVDITNNNHNYMRHAVNMEWGALMGNDAYFQKGVEGYIVALGQMRPDGSFPLETARGAMAISYTSHAISSLVLIAEIAANQGHNLYDLEQNDLSLHSAITFLLDAIDNPEIIVDYAAENDTCTNPEACGDYRKQWLELNMGWIEPYRARFPESESTRRINQMFEEGVLDYSRWPGTHEEIGMLYPNSLDGAATRCFYSRINISTPTPTLSPEQEISLFVYDDAAEPGWDIHVNFGEGEIDLSSKSAVHNGQFAIEAKMDPWGSFAMWTKPLDTSQFLYLEFYINGGSQGGQMINVLTFGEGVVLTNLATSIYTGARILPPEEWLMVRIPVEDLNPNNDPVTGFVIENHSDDPAATFYVDDIRFVAAGP